MPDGLRFSDAEKASFRSTYAPHASDEHFNLFIQECERRALVPGTHVVFQTRKSSEWNAALGRKVDTQKVTLITTINALRLIAERSGKYDGHGPFIFYYLSENGDMRESKIPLGKVPHAVSVEGFRKDWKAPLFATARYAAYAQMRDVDGEKKPTQMWAAGSGRAEEMLAKCCEALMLKTVSPEECAGLLLSEEVGEEQPMPEPLKETLVELPKATIAPIVNQEACSLVSEPEVTKSVIKEVEAAFPDKEAPQPAATLFPRSTSLLAQREAILQPSLTSAEPSSGVAPVQQVNPPQPAAVAIPVVTAASGTAPIVAGDTPCDSKKYSVFITERASKIIRDKLPQAGLRDQAASNGVKNYLLKSANKTELKKISEADFERLLSALENATPEEAAKIVTAVK